jgi:hypothetical protein
MTEVTFRPTTPAASRAAAGAKAARAASQAPVTMVRSRASSAEP